jgi:hypothetical protein
MLYKETRATVRAEQLAPGTAAWIGNTLYIKVYIADLEVAIWERLKDKPQDYQTVLRSLVKEIEEELVLFANIGGGGLRWLKKDERVIVEPTAAYTHGARGVESSS